MDANPGSLSQATKVAVLLFPLLWPSATGLSAETHPVATSGTYELHPSLEISLFAREPDIVDPVALCFDEDGRVFVVEMRDYPYGSGADRKPGGTIRLL